VIILSTSPTHSSDLEQSQGTCDGRNDERDGEKLSRDEDTYSRRGFIGLMLTKGRGRLNHSSGLGFDRFLSAPELYEVLE
jgi:hypothetical protein